MRYALLLAVVLGNAAGGRGSMIKLVSNGYERVVVAIHESIPEDHAIIDEIKNMFIEASEFLCQATRMRAYFRSVTILIPKTWSDDAIKYNTSEGERFVTADVRIDSSNPKFGDDPYTKQPGQCGEEGHYMHLTSNFILNPSGMRIFTHGPIGKLLVHEFAHLRWGVFDEYGYKNDDNHPLFYISNNGDVRPTACSEKIQGLGIDENTGRLCENNADTGLPTESCVFRDEAAADFTSSIMYKQSLRPVVSFCESRTNNPSLLHNAMAPNKHNKMCGNRGTWDVIQEHVDFAAGSNPPNEEVINKAPSFELVNPRTPQKIVLVLDTSGSMMRNKGVAVQRHYQMKQAFSTFMKDSVPTGTEVGVVAFSSRANILSQLTVISNDSVRNHMVTALDDCLFGGSTAIAAGIDLGISVLSSGDLSGSKLLVMTDGEELVRSNAPLKIGDPNFISKVVDSGVVVDALGFGPDASKDVERIATKTGGRVYYYSESLESTALDRALASAVEEFGDTPIEVESYTSQFNGSSTMHTASANIDFSLGKETKFVFSCPENSNFRVDVTSPNGTNYASDDDEYQYDTSHNVIRVIIPEAESGEWTYRLSTTDDLASLNSTHNVIINVNSHPSEGVAPIVTKAWINKGDINYVNDYPVLYADVSQGPAPVINATVRAIIERPVGDVVTLILKDNGIGADTHKNDGVYSVYFTDILTNGRYPLEVVVDNGGGMAGTLLGGGGKSAAKKMLPSDSADVDVEGLPFFKRTAIAGTFNVRNYTNDTDPYPPVRITDLKVAKVSHQTVTLTFTAPGGDLDKGRATAYDIRVSNSFAGLNEYFSEAVQFSTDDVSEGMMLPESSGNQQTITFSVQKIQVDNGVLFFAMTSKDANGNVANLSNIVSTVLRQSFDWVPLVAGLSGAFIFLLLLVVGGVTYYKYKNKKNKVVSMTTDVPLA